MITKQVIDSLYKKYSKMPKHDADRNIDLLRNFALENEAVDIDGNKMIFYNTDPGSIFSEIELDRVHAAVDFEDAIAIVFHSSILFLLKKDASVHVHIKPIEASLTDKLKFWLSN